MFDRRKLTRALGEIGFRKTLGFASSLPEGRLRATQQLVAAEPRQQGPYHAAGALVNCFRVS